jgi:transglutaminase-like putative cysteine protease
MRFRVGCELGYQVNGPASFVLNIEPARLPRQEVVREELTLTPEVPVQRHVMPESANRYLRFVPRPGELTVRYEAEVALDPLLADPATIPEVPAAGLPFEVLPHLYPSRYCQSDRLARAALELVRGVPPGHARVTALCNWIHDNVAYLRGASDVHTSAADTLVERAGVCRDFAHLGVALCRALGVPARFVSAYALGLVPPDFHAVFEAWLGDRWWLFDPTRQAALDGLVRIGVGRDAAEVSFATINGAATPTAMAVRIERLDGGADPAVAERTALAVSTADA